MYAAVAALAEVVNTASDRVVARKVGAGSLAWGLLGLRLLVMNPTPILFHAGPRRLRAAKWLSMWWARSDTLVAAAIDSVMLGLARRAPPPRAGDRVEASS